MTTLYPEDLSRPMPFDAALLACIRCGASLQQPHAGSVHCSQCGHPYPVQDGFLDLRPDPDACTQLIEHHYNAEHGIDDTRRLNLWLSWQAVLQKHGCEHGDALEIGVGSGQLTWGLLHHSMFRALHICDISPRFLHLTAQTVAQAPCPASYYLCDANQLPFRHNSIDCIIGNSVLHHFLDYERTLSCVHAALKPGGAAVFYEPVQQGKAPVSLLLRLLRDTDAASSTPLFTPEQHRRLSHMSQHIVKQAPSREAASDLDKLQLREDKYIFDIPSLQRLARQIGFASLHTENNASMDYSYWPYVLQPLLMAGFRREQLMHYRYLFDSVRDTLGSMLTDTFTSPMVFLVLRK